MNRKTAVITGAASGIGKALALQCLKEDMQVVLADIDHDALAALQPELEPFKTRAVCVKTDVRQPDDSVALLSHTLKHFGEVNMLFNNAGVGGPIGPLWAVPNEKIRFTFEVNVLGVINALQAFVPHMLAQDKTCYIINTAAMSGFFTYPLFGTYQISKHAVVALSEALQHDLSLKNSKIKVAVLCPGFVKTNIIAHQQAAQTSSLEDLNTLDDESMHWLLTFVRHLRRGTDPNKIAAATLKALREEKFYIITHPEMKSAIEKRMMAILTEAQPALFTPE